jgi:hypothetical protein
MQWARRIVWNDAERRLRAGWRLFIQPISNLVLAALLLALLNRWSSPEFNTSRVAGLMGAALFLAVTLLTVWLAGHCLDRRTFSGFWLRPGQARGGPIWALLWRWALSCRSDPFEELARAYQIRNLLEGTYGGLLRPVGSMIVAVAGAALISVAMHRGDASYLFYVSVSASVMGLFYLLTGRMAITAGTHMAFDFALLALFGIGAEAGGAAVSLFRVQQDALSRSAGDGLGLTPVGLICLCLVWKSRACFCFWAGSTSATDGPDRRRDWRRHSILGC